MIRDWSDGIRQMLRGEKDLVISLCHYKNWVEGVESPCAHKNKTKI